MHNQIPIFHLNMALNYAYILLGVGSYEQYPCGRLGLELGVACTYLSSIDPTTVIGLIYRFNHNILVDLCWSTKKIDEGYL